MKETNLEHYKEQLKKIYNEHFDEPSDVFDEIINNIDSGITTNASQTYTDDILEWMAQPYGEKILNEAEREYLSYVIRPFREKIECIFKAKFPNYDEYYIIVGLENNDSLRFPYFKGNTMYKGMEVDKEYALEELGL